MIDELQISQVFMGFRNKPAGDLNALAEAIVAISRLADVEHVAIVDAEINPLIILPAGQGVIAVDALVQVAS
jgi:succinyl-CoA synthetase beta subunit